MNRFGSYLLLLLLLPMHISANENYKLQLLIRNFAKGYQQLGAAPFVYSIQEYFQAVASMDSLQKQQQFFLSFQNKSKSINRTQLQPAQQVQFDHLQYEIAFQLKRIELEKQWRQSGAVVPEHTLYELKNHEVWYSYFIQRYTGLELGADAITKLGNQEVARVSAEIETIRKNSGRSVDSFYANLNADFFYETDEKALLHRFAITDSVVRRHLTTFVGETDVPAVQAVRWPGATAATPPGMYVNAANSDSGKSIFEFNFSTGKFNWRAAEWLYLHEAIPGHHLQFTFRSKNQPDALQQLFLYPGNFEGWGCYVEYYGSELGLYRNPYSLLGKWEWDLVRSARLILDAGIHHQGWSTQQARDFWKLHIPNQDDISEREINRVTNWAAQALTYKVGADFISKLRLRMEEKYGGNFNPVAFHQTYLSFGMRPLAVIEKNFETMYALQLSSIK